MGFQDIGKALAILRQQRGISQVELAESCGIGRSQISRYESGRELMRLETLERILSELAVAPDEFFRFLASLDPASAPAPQRVPDRINDRRLTKAFRNLHSAIDELREVIEGAFNPALRSGRTSDEAAADRGRADHTTES
jgi:transcriptional regulator with XRE-family HTH domain